MYNEWAVTISLLKFKLIQKTESELNDYYTVIFVQPACLYCQQNTQMIEDQNFMFFCIAVSEEFQLPDAFNYKYRDVILYANTDQHTVLKDPIILSHFS